MIEVLEIPVFLSSFDYSADLLPADWIKELEGNEFKYSTVSLPDKRGIIFYIFEVKETIENASVLDRLVPKAPFCFLILKGETFKINNFCESYKDRYSNPLVCLFPQHKNDFDLTYVNNNVLKNDRNYILKFQPGEDADLNKILITSLNHLLKGQE